MENAISHVQKTYRRIYRGEAEAADLLNWLNWKSSSPIRQQAKGELEDSLKLLQSVYAMPPDKRPSAELRSAQARLNLWLGNYALVHQLDHGDSGPIWRLKNIADLPRNLAKGEAECVARMLELAEVGVILQIRQCVCGRYFFARFPHQRFCPGGKCQQEFHKFNDADKKRRREWARENYQNRKALELGSRKAAQRKEKS